MTPELPRKNMKFEGISTLFDLIFNEDEKLRDLNNHEFSQKTAQLVLALRQAFLAYSDFFEQKGQAKGPDLSRLRHKISSVAGGQQKPAKTDTTLPAINELKNLWDLIGHLSHKVCIDEVFDENPQIEQMIMEIGQIIGLNKEDIEKGRNGKEAKKTGSFLDLDALRDKVTKAGNTDK